METIRKISFKLLSGEIYEWSDKGYMDFISNLETSDSGSDSNLINVLESFSLEDFNDANFEYEKYCCFKEKQREIISVGVIQSYTEIIKNMDYNINNPILNWLGIRENIDDVEFKNMIFRKIKEKLKFNEIIINLCKNNLFKTLNWFYLENSENININEIVEDNLIEIQNEFKGGTLKFICFKLACRNGYIDIIRWLLLFEGPINKVDDIRNSMEIKKEACSIGFYLACLGGHIDVAQWIYSIFYPNGYLDIHYKNEGAFCGCCKSGNLELTKWLFEVSESSDRIDIHIFNEYPFRMSIAFRHLHISKWLYEISRDYKEIDLHAENDDVFKSACINGDLEIAKWLFSVSREGFEIKDIKTKHEIIINWLSGLVDKITII